MNNESPAIVAHAAQPTRFIRQRVLVAGGAGFIGSHLCFDAMSHDITLTLSLNGWNPHVKLVTGLTQTDEYFKAELQSARRAESGQ